MRERQKQQTREHLLQTAGELFGQKGASGTSIDDIVAAAGISRATLYAYFDGKDALLAAIVEQMWIDGLRYYEDFGKLPDWSRGSILRWVRRFAEAWQRDAARNKAAAVAAPTIFLEAGSRHRQMVAAVRCNDELWEHFTTVEAELRAAMVVNVVESQFADYFFNGSSVDLDVFIGIVTDAVRELLRVA